MNLTGGMDHYDYNVTGDKNSVRSYELAFGINQYHGRADFNYAPNNDHLFNFGVSSINYKMQPGTLTPKGNQSLVIPDKLNPEQARESAILVIRSISIPAYPFRQVSVTHSINIWVLKQYKIILMDCREMNLPEPTAQSMGREKQLRRIMVRKSGCHYDILFPTTVHSNGVIIHYGSISISYQIQRLSLLPMFGNLATRI